MTAYSNPVGQFHRYRYANNNPYRFTDPDGRKASMLDHPGISVSSVQGVSVEGKGHRATFEANRRLLRTDSVRRYDSESEMYATWGRAVDPIARHWGVEIGSLTYSVAGGGYVFGPAFSSGHSTSIFGLFDNWSIASSKLHLNGLIHTHPGSAHFSGEDLAYNAYGESKCIFSGRGGCGSGDIYVALDKNIKVTLVHGGVIKTFDPSVYSGLIYGGGDKSEFVPARDAVR